MPHKKFTPTEIQAIIDNYSYSHSYTAVAEKFGCSPSTVKKYVSSQNEEVLNIFDAQNFDDIEDFADIDEENLTNP